MAGSGGNNKRIQYCTDQSEQDILYFRDPVDPSLQDNVLIPDKFFEYISNIGCAINLHSNHKFRIDSGRTKFSRDRETDRQRVFFTAVNPMHENHQDHQELDLTKPRLASYKQPWKVHQDPYEIDLTAPRLAWYKQKTWKNTPRHGVLGRYAACSTERIEVLSMKIERNHPLRHTSSLLYPESCCDGIWRNHIRDSVCVTSASSDDFL